MNEALTAAASLGVGALLAVVIFIMYRYDRMRSENQLREDRKFMEDRLTSIIQADQVSREANTSALVELTTLLVRMNGRNKS